MQTMAIEMLNRMIMNSNIATKHRTARVRRQEPKRAGGTGDADTVLRSVKLNDSLVGLVQFRFRV